MGLTELARTRELIEQGIVDGLHTGAQVFASIDTEPVASLAIGEARPGVPMTDDTLVLWLSSSKPVAAVAIMQLRERGLCDLDEPVATHLPEFAANGKQAVTIRHLLTHTAGFRWVDADPKSEEPDEILQRIYAAPLEDGWVPGAKAGYHPTSSWFVLGELVHRIDGRPFSHYVRAAIFEPLAMNDCWIGMSREVVESYGSRIAPMPNTEQPDAGIHPLSTERGLTKCVPGAGGFGPMNQLAHLYEMFLGRGTRDGVRVLSADSVDLMTSRQRVGMFDDTFKYKMDWGLGLIINSRHYGEFAPYGFGPSASAQTFGHSGSQSSIGMADPEYRLALAIEFNGMPGERRHQKRVRAVLAAVYEDLGLFVS